MSRNGLHEGVQGSIWRAVVGSGDQFEVSNEGHVRKTLTKKLVKLTRNDRGYLCCGVAHGGKRRIRKVHIMVAEAFIGPRPEGHEAVLKDGNKDNCHIENLRYATPKQHAEDRLRRKPYPSAKLTFDQVYEMRKLIDAGLGLNEVAERFETSHANVKSISRRRTWKRVELLPVERTVGD